MKLKLALIIGLLAKLALAVSTMAIPNLIYLENQDIRYNYNTKSNNDIDNIRISNGFSEDLTKEFNLFNADVRGAIINSGQFKVIDYKNNLKEANADSNIWQINNAVTQKLIKSTTNGLTTESAIESSQVNLAVESNSITTADSITKGADYILIGQVVSVDENKNNYNIKNTDKSTVNYSLSVSVEYKLIGNKDKRIVAAFTAYGSSSQIKIISTDSNQVVHFNKAKLVRDTSKDLAQNVVSSLNEQLTISNKVTNSESPIVTDFKTYD